MTSNVPANIPALGPDASLNRYLSEIRKFPLLKPEEEYMLAKRWQEHEDPQAATRLVNACMAEPWYVAGSGRACTKLMEMAPGRIFVKTGAEGVFCAAIPELGLGIALKCEDGSTRAAETMVAAVLARFFKQDDALYAALMGFANRSMFNWNGLHVGDIRVAEGVFDA